MHDCTGLMNHTHSKTGQGCGVALTPIVIGNDHGNLLIQSALHSLRKHLLADTSVTFTSASAAENQTEIGCDISLSLPEMATVELWYEDHL